MTKPIVIAKPIKRLNLLQLLKGTPTDIVHRAGSQCHIVRKQYEVGSKDGFRRTYIKNKQYYNEMRIYSTCLDGKRTSYIRFFGKPEKEADVWVWCSCPYFTYNLEVVLARQNSSTVKFSNGQMPRVRNADLIPHLCKHLIVGAKMALTMTQDLAAEKLEEERSKKMAASLNPQKGKVIPKSQFTQPKGSPGLVEIS